MSDSRVAEDVSLNIGHLSPTMQLCSVTCACSAQHNWLRMLNQISVMVCIVKVWEYSSLFISFTSHYSDDCQLEFHSSDTSLVSKFLRTETCFSLIGFSQIFLRP